jgi:hypothetical protein
MTSGVDVAESAAERQRRRRERRRLGLRVVPVTVSDEAVRAWVSAGQLDPDAGPDEIAELCAEIIEEFAIVYSRHA